MCIQFWSYLRGAKFTLPTDHRSLVWLHRYKDTEGMMARWLHALQQFHFSIIHRPGNDHGNADGFRTTYTSRLPLHRLPRIWNELETKFHDIESLKSFKKNVRNNFPNKYSANIRCTNTRCKHCFHTLWHYIMTIWCMLYIMMWNIFDFDLI